MAKKIAEKLLIVDCYLFVAMVGIAVLFVMVQFGIENVWVLVIVPVLVAWMVGFVAIWFLLCLPERFVFGRWSILKDLEAKVWTSALWFITFLQMDLGRMAEEMNAATQ